MSEESKEVAVIDQEAGARSLAVFGLTSQQLAEFDTDKLGALLQMHKEHQAEQARLAYFKALHALREEMTPVIKRRTNAQTASKYAPLEDYLEMLNPLFNKHGFVPSLSSRKSEKPDHTLFVLVLRHKEGYFEEHMLDAPIDDIGIKGKTNKTKIHGLGSSATYCFRYLITGVLGVQAIEDDDGNAAGGVGPGSAGISENQIREIEDLLEATKSDRKKFTDYFQRDEVSELTQMEFKQAIAMLKRKLK